MEIVRIPVRNRKSTTTRTLKIIVRHDNIVSETSGVEYASFLARRVRFNDDGSTSTYGADHAYLVPLADVTVVETRQPSLNDALTAINPRQALSGREGETYTVPVRTARQRAVRELAAEFGTDDSEWDI